MRDQLRTLICQALESQAKEHNFQLDCAKLNFSIEYPPQPEFGDYATNAAILFAKKRDKDPIQVANEIRSTIINKEKIFENISVANKGFLNFTLSRDFVRTKFKEFSPASARTNKHLSFLNKKQGVILIEYSSPNIGKPLSIAHLRSTIIGDSLARIHRWLGYRVITDNHLGDWGLQAGILVAAHKLWGKKPIAKTTMPELLELYVKYNAEMKSQEELAAQTRIETVLLQQGNRKTIEIWNQVREKSSAEFNRLYKILNVQFDYTLGESAYRKDFPNVIKIAQKSGIATESQGAIVIPFGKDEPPLIIQKNDGGYLYATFDLATMRYRVKRWKPQQMLYVVANEQTQYFDQVFRAGEKLGWLKREQAIHVKFGMLRGEDLKKLSTRGGKIFLLEDVINEAISRARKIVEDKNPSLSKKEKESISRMIGIGALKYNDLSQNRNTDIIFDWNRMLDLTGNSAPYIQYSYARLRSIVHKSQISPSKLRKTDLAPLNTTEELMLIKKVLQLPEAVRNAAKELAPNFVANYLWGLANLASAFYEKHPVLKAESGLRHARLALIAKTAATLKAGLDLLGIEAPERV